MPERDAANPSAALSWSDIVSGSESTSHGSEALLDNAVGSPRRNSNGSGGN